MIGQKVKFRITRYDLKCKIGEVLDKIDETKTTIRSGQYVFSSDIPISRTKTYYLIADEKGRIHSVPPYDVLSVVPKT